jgi:hypothetical protein
MTSLPPPHCHKCGNNNKTGCFVKCVKCRLFTCDYCRDYNNYCKNCGFIEYILLLLYDRKIQNNDANLISKIIVSKVDEWNYN